METVSFEVVQGLALHSGWVLALLPFVSEQSRAESSVSLRLRCQVNRSVRSWIPFLKDKGEEPTKPKAAPAAASDEQLRTVHTEDWIQRVTAGNLTSDELRRIGFPWSLQMVERCRRSTGATIEASVCALQDGAAANLAGGTHHAFPDRGAGYCVFNDVAVAARVMQSQGAAQRILIADGDVHQGDGTAFIFQHDESVRTFSLHAAKAFPARKMISDVDIELPPGADDDGYLEAWQRGFLKLMQEMLKGTIQATKPQVVQASLF